MSDTLQCLVDVFWHVFSVFQKMCKRVAVGGTYKNQNVIVAVRRCGFNGSARIRADVCSRCIMMFGSFVRCRVLFGACA